MNRLTRIIAGAALAAAISTSSVVPFPAMAAGVKRLVDNDKVECPTATYTTVSTAIADAGPGDTITVCDGEYTEQLFIISKSGLKLIGKGMPRIIAPVNTDGAIIQVEDSLNVTVEGLIVDGNLKFSPSSSSMIGIYFRNSSGTIRKNIIRGIRRYSLTSLSQGEGILLYYNATTTPHPVKILNNTIYDYQHAGVWVDVGYKPTITRNLIQATSVAFNEPTGIMLKGLGGGSVSNNLIVHDFNDYFFTTGRDSTGIALVDTSGVKVASNTIRASRRGVHLDSPKTAVENNTISGNRIYDSREGIFLGGFVGMGFNNNTVKGNKILSVSFWTIDEPLGVYVESPAAGNRIIGNTIQGYLKPGYQAFGTGTTISGNKWTKAVPPGS